MSHSVQYTELHTPNPQEATAFYGALFDWQSKTIETPAGPYMEVTNGDGPVGGIFNRPDGGDPHWLIYITTADVDASVTRAKELGGSVLQEKQEVPDMGYYAILEDPHGAIFALWQAKG
ncbi:MAG: VOC family protein [Acidobacteriota bacterium]